MAILYAAVLIDENLNGKDIIAVPLADENEMKIGYIVHQKNRISRLGTTYLKALEKYLKSQRRTGKGMSAYAAGISKNISAYVAGIIKNITAYAEGTIKNALAYAEKSHGQFRFFRFNWYR